MNDKHASPLPADPLTDALGDLLDFTPVSLRHRSDGWTPERQRLYVAALARWGSGRRAAAHVNLSEQTAARLRARPDGASFARACERAWQIGKIARRRGTSGFSSPGPNLINSMNLPAPPHSGSRP